MEKRLIKYGLFVLAIFFLQSLQYSQVPYVPTPEVIVDDMLKLAAVTENDIVYDLGCGDGRIVVAAAKKYGAHAVGVDNNPERIRDSWANAKQEGVENKVNFLEQNLFDTNLRDASVVTLYLLTEVNLKLRPKLFQELKPGTRVVSHSFSMDTWQPDSIRLVDDRYIYFWRIPANASGNWVVTLKNKKENEKYSLQLDQIFQQVEGSLQKNSEKYYISDARLNGTMLQFTTRQNSKNGKVKMLFNAEIKDDEMNGTIRKDGENDLISFTAKRQEGTLKPLDPKISKAGLKLNTNN